MKYLININYHSHCGVVEYIQTWKRLIFVRKPIFRIEKCIETYCNFSNTLIVDKWYRLVAIYRQKLSKICYLSKCVQNCLKNCPKLYISESSTWGQFTTFSRSAPSCQNSTVCQKFVSQTYSGLSYSLIFNCCQCNPHNISSESTWNPFRANVK